MLATAEECAGVIAGDAMDERAQAILQYQRARIAEGDTGRHQVSSALRLPARASHAPHGKQSALPRKRGFFGWLFGFGKR